MRADVSEKGVENGKQEEVCVREEDLSNGIVNCAAKDADDVDDSFVLVSVDSDFGLQSPDDADRSDPATPGVPAAVSALEISGDVADCSVSPLPSGDDPETESVVNAASDLPCCEVESAVEPEIGKDQETDTRANGVVSLPSTDLPSSGGNDEKTDSRPDGVVSLPPTDLPSGGVEDAVDSKESNEKSNGNLETSPVEIETDLVAIHPDNDEVSANGVVSLASMDLPACDVEEVTDSKESDEKSNGELAFCPVEIENNPVAICLNTDTVSANGVVSLPSTDLPSPDTEDAKYSKESSEESNGNLDSYPVVIDNDPVASCPDNEARSANGVASLPLIDIPSGTDDATDSKESNGKSNGDSHSYPVEIENDQESDSQANGVVPLPSTDLPSSEVEDATDSKVSCEKINGILDSCPADIQNDPVTSSPVNDTDSGNGVVSLPVADLLSCDAEDVTALKESNERNLGDHNSSPAEIVHDPLASCPDTNVGSQPETCDGGEGQVSGGASREDAAVSNESYEKSTGNDNSPEIENGLVVNSCDNNVGSQPETSDGGENQVSAAATDSSGIENEDQLCTGDHHVGPSEEKVSTGDSSGIANGDLESSGDHHVGLDTNASIDDDKLEIVAEDIQAKPSSDKPSEEDGAGAVNSRSLDVGRGESEPSQEVEGTTNGEPISSEEPNEEVEVVKSPFYYLIRVPKYEDGTLREQIKLAEVQVQEGTKARDAIRSKLQHERASIKEYADKVQAAVAAERAARDAIKAKRQEMEPLQSVINKLKDALSVEDIDARIRHMEHMIQHESLPLKEEKQFIRDIKQLKQQRSEICLTLGKQDEIQQAQGQKDQVEERMKGLKKELDSLRVDFTKAERITLAARQQLKQENEKLNELVYQFKVADEIRQEAYAHFQSLRTQLKEKNKHFYEYRNDLDAAKTLALNKDKEQLQHLCVGQVERVMALWNNNDDFRREYVERNTRSTLWRLRTLDGRALGPDEQPPVIPSPVITRVAKQQHNMEKPSSIIPQPEKETVKEKEILVAVKAESPDEKRVPEVAAAKKLAEAEEMTRLIKEKEEKEELARKAKEQQRKQEEVEAKLKEVHRLEEIAKAKEAMERKRRNAEKAQARAVVRAQKEAEEKQKEREKKARKKERKKQANGNGPTNNNEEEEHDDATTPNEPPSADETTAVTKTVMAKKAVVKKRSIGKTKATMPQPLRNKGKRRFIQPWMLYLALPILIFLALCLFLFPIPNLHSLF